MYSDVGRQSAGPVGWVKSGCHLSFDALPYYLDMCSSVGKGTHHAADRGLIEGMGKKSSEASGLLLVFFSLE